MSPKKTIQSRQVPQEDRLSTIRLVLKAVAESGDQTEAMGRMVGITRRHVGYSLAAAQTLGWLPQDNTNALTPSARDFLATAPGSAAEREAFLRAILVSDIITQLAPGLLQEKAPSKEALVESILSNATGIGIKTASRRAQTLLSWRKHAMATQEEQLSLLGADPTLQSMVHAYAAFRGTASYGLAGAG